MSNPGPATTVSAHPSNVTTNQALRLLAVAKGVNANAVATTQIQVNNSTTYMPKELIITNSNNTGTSVSAASLVATITPASGSGTSIFGSVTASNCTTNLGVQYVDASATSTAYQGQYLYANVTTASGNTGTVDIYVYGYDFS